MKINVIIALTVALLLIFTNYSVSNLSGSVKTAHSDLDSPFSEDSEESSASENQVSTAKKPSGKAPEISSKAPSSNSNTATSSSNSTASNAEAASSDNSSPQEEYPAGKITQVYELSSQYTFELPEMQRKSFKDSKSGKTLPYRLYIPENYSASKQYPVFFWLHGAGERGSDNYTQIQYLSKAFKAAGDLLSGAIIVAPQCPSDGWWNIDEYDYEYEYRHEAGWLGAAMHLLDKIRFEYSCDSDRIYVSGLSWGGYATWSALEYYGGVFAAGAPICGWGNSYAGEQLAKIPIWIYHGDADQTVSYQASTEMYNAIKNAGGNMVHFTTLYGVDHNAWDYALTDRELFCWMFAQTKAKSRNGDDSYEYEELPHIRLVSPQNETIFTEEDIDYYGKYFSGDATYLTAYLNSGAAARLRKAYKNNLDKEFTVYIYSDKLYKFKPLVMPDGDEFVFADCLTSEMIYSLL